MNYISDAWDIVRLRADALRKVAEDRRAFRVGLLFVAVEGLAMAGSLYPVMARPTLFTALPVILILFSFLVVGIIHVAATLFGGTAGFRNLYRPLALCSVLGWFRIFSWLPYFFWITGAIHLWRIVILYAVLRNVCKLSAGRAVAVVGVVSLIGVVVLRLIILEWERGHMGGGFDDLGA